MNLTVSLFTLEGRIGVHSTIFVAEMILMQDLDKFNEFFIDKEEDFIIRIQALDDSLERDKTQDVKKLGKLRKAYADLHGAPFI